MKHLRLMCAFGLMAVAMMAPTDAGSTPADISDDTPTPEPGAAHELAGEALSHEAASNVDAENAEVAAADGNEPEHTHESGAQDEIDAAADDDDDAADGDEGDDD